MKILGVTGGTASGKSEVCRILEEEGGKIIDADLISKQLQRKGQNAYNEIVGYFGIRILNEDGELNRKAIAEIVFKDRNELIKLNAMVHKYVSYEIKRLVNEYRKCDYEFVVLDVPIPVEEGFFDTADCIWTVVANQDLRIQRLKKRMGITEREAVTRIQSQMSNSEYESIADVVIVNEGDVEELKKHVLFELKRFLY